MDVGVYFGFGSTGTAAIRSSSGISSKSQFQIQLAVTLLLLGTAGLCVVGWTTSTSKVTTSAPLDLGSSTIGDLKEIQYRLNSKSVCLKSHERPFFLALIHSKAQHFRQRQVIRSTWASQHSTVLPVFLLGSVQQKHQHSSYVDEQSVIEAERTKYGDIVQGDFIDHYRNMTIKNLMGLQWATKYCPDARFILKSDDDAFIDVVQLRQFIQRTWSPSGDPSDDTIICSVHRDAPVQRTGKWAVTKAEYSASTYPPFCSGLAYVIKPSMAKQLLQAATDDGLLWIDDVYVTGVLAKAVRANHFYLNLRYSHQQDEVVRWLDSNDANTSSPLPYIVSELDTSRSDWPELAQRLWTKTPKYSVNERNVIETLWNW